MLERTVDVIQEIGGSGTLGPQPPGEQEVRVNSAWLLDLLDEIKCVFALITCISFTSIF